ncbi:MAG: CHASE3 domain-containing protein [Devosia sp.]
MPTSLRTVVWSTAIFLLVGLLALVGIVGATLWLGERAQAYSSVAAEARLTRSAAIEFRNALQGAESGQRGYVIARNEIYLAPYATAKTQAARQFSLLEGRLADQPEARVPLERLAAIVDEKFAEMDRIIALERAGQHAEALLIFNSNRGKALMDEANVFVSGLVRRIEDQLATGIAEQQANAGLLRLVSAAGAFVIIAVVGGAGYMLSRYAAEARQARDEVRALNAGLERRVEERTADLVVERDKAEILLSEVNHRLANSLALVASLVSMQAKSLEDPAAKAALGEAHDRILAISLVHRRLYGSRDVRAVTLDEYLAALLEQLKASLHGDGQASIKHSLDPVTLPTDTAINLGVVVTEWVTNAFKYAYPNGSGEVRVRLARLPEGRVELAVEDDGVGHPEGEAVKGTGLGTRIVRAMAASMRADVEYSARHPGFSARYVFTPAAG